MKKTQDIMDTLRAVEHYEGSFTCPEDLIVSIDPGSTGGVIMLVDLKGHVLWKSYLPTIKREKYHMVDFDKLVEILTYLNQTFRPRFVVEHVHYIKNTLVGKIQQWNFAFACAVIDCSFKCCGIVPTMIKPQVWQKSMWESVGKVVLKTGGGMQKTDTKATSLKVKERLYPDSDCRISSRGTKSDHNYVDCLLLAMYLTRITNN